MTDDAHSESFITVNTSQFTNEEDFQSFIDCVTNSNKSPISQSSKKKVKKCRRRRAKNVKCEIDHNTTTSDVNEDEFDTTFNDTNDCSSFNLSTDKTFDESEYGDLFKYFEEDSQIFDSGDINESDDEIKLEKKLKRKNSIKKFIKNMVHKTRNEEHVLNNRVESNNRSIDSKSLEDCEKYEKRDIDFQEKLIKRFCIKDRIKFFNAFFAKFQIKLNNDKGVFMIKSKNNRNLYEKFNVVSENDPVVALSPLSKKKQSNLKIDYEMQTKINKKLVNSNYEVKKDFSEVVETTREISNCTCGNVELSGDATMECVAKYCDNCYDNFVANFIADNQENLLSNSFSIDKLAKQLSSIYFEVQIILFIFFLFIKFVTSFITIFIR